MDDLRPLAFYFNHIVEKFTSLTATYLDGTEITPSQMPVLIFLFCRCDLGVESTTLRDIEYHLRKSHATVTGIIQRLEDKDFVRTETLKTDKRSKNVILQPKAFEFKCLLMNSEKHLNQKIQQTFSPDQMNDLLELLSKLYQVVCDMPERAAIKS